MPFELGDPRPLRGLFDEADVVIMRPPSPLVAGWLRASEARIVYDLCDPLPLDILEAQASSSRERQLLWHTLALDHFLAALHAGHHFICSGRRQRDLYLGALLASRLIQPAAYSADPSFRSFLDLVPFGIPSEAPQRVAGAGPRARYPGARGGRADRALERRHLELARPRHRRRGDGQGRRALILACGWCSCSRTARSRRPGGARGARRARARASGWGRSTGSCSSTTTDLPTPSARPG